MRRQKRMKKHNTIYVTGSLTLEATLLMPFILAVICILLYLSFYFHNQIILEAIACESAIKASQIKDETEMYNLLDQLLENKLLGGVVTKKQVFIGENEIEVILLGKMDIPGMAFMNIILPYEELRIYAKKNLPIYSTSSLIREIRLYEALKTMIEE